MNSWVKRKEVSAYVRSYRAGKRKMAAEIEALMERLKRGGEQ